MQCQVGRVINEEREEKLIAKGMLEVESQNGEQTHRIIIGPCRLRYLEAESSNKTIIALFPIACSCAGHMMCLRFFVDAIKTMLLNLSGF